MSADHPDTIAPPAPQVVLVVGAAGGIGTALCRRLAARGARLVLCGRDRARLEALARETPGDVLPLDARDLAAVGAAVEATVARYGRLDGAVNLPGSILLKPAHSTSAEEWTDVIDTNLRTAFALVRAAAPALRKAGGGSIVLLSSAAARHGLANHEALAAAKAGVEGLALSAAATYAPRGVRVNVVAPGLVRTPLAAKLLSSAASVEASVAMHPLHRLGEPEDVASAIDWLLDPAQRWVTGQVLGVDGGLGSVQAR
jgi:NAD(P)-dependent dehydrogenase (short-subunit alcohol dehydrogenase family)